MHNTQTEGKKYPKLAMKMNPEYDFACRDGGVDIALKKLKTASFLPNPWGLECV